MASPKLTLALVLEVLLADMPLTAAYIRADKYTCYIVTMKGNKYNA